MTHVTGLKCTICGAVYAQGDVEYVCPQDGGNLDVQYDYDLIRHDITRNGLSDEPGMWRYRPLMPVEHETIAPPILVGNTPLYYAERLAANLQMDRVWIKDDGRNPTASLKDRASAIVVALGKAEGRPIITTASTGNAAAATAGVAASVGMPAVIFVPATAPVAKVTQLLVYGAHVLLVQGTYDDAFDLCLKASDAYGWYCRNTGYNPYTQEGKKTVSYEICEQLAGAPGQFRAPDSIVVSVGDGNIISGVHKGLRDLLALGLIERMPRLIGVQAEGSAALYNAWRDGIDPAHIQPVDAKTIADSISAGLPRDPVKAINAVVETRGAYITVSDEEIIAAIPRLARASGVFAEPAAAAAYAGLIKARANGV
ncbi:MAG: threonine synthase, partial [Anaerolineae bacterium]|nr:threonine synthase [Anaerolineae bacterium]